MAADRGEGPRLPVRADSCPRILDLRGAVVQLLRLYTSPPRFFFTLQYTFQSGSCGGENRNIFLRSGIYSLDVPGVQGYNKAAFNRFRKG